ncbi:hypothetical protein B296_00059051 [Ensete ventricosum]|uniref:Uncharacterized protein n=1 Tax=Ensete ventricosum TaxID=4639 RepID=A0A426WVN9_ENSVE|nr:hypothetical protein B296_00059051 [Ensete ventricosum]
MSQPGEVTHVRKVTSVLPIVKGAAGWSDCRVRSVMRSVACCQGRCKLVGPSCSLCHATSRPLSRALQVGRPITSALPCDQPRCRAIGRPQSGVLRIDRDFKSSSCLC